LPSTLPLNEILVVEILPAERFPVTLNVVAFITLPVILPVTLKLEPVASPIFGVTNGALAGI
jgi:hypothetical protein